MELFQVFWDDQRNLFLEFKKNKNEKHTLLPETVKRINLRYEISKNLKVENYHHQFSNMLSIKTFYFFNEFLAFAIDLSELNNTEDLQIKILSITIFLYSGQKLEYSIKRTFVLSEICVNEDCYTNYSYDEVEIQDHNENSVFQQKIYQELEKDFKNNKEKKKVIYETNKIKGTSNNEVLTSIVRENTEAMNSIVDQLKELNATLKNLSLNNIGYISPGLSQTGPPKRIENKGALNLNAKIKPPGQLPFLAELKEIIADEDKFKTYLKPMNEEELKSLILNDDELNRKEEESIERQIKRLEKESLTNLNLEDLSKPK